MSGKEFEHLHERVGPPDTAKNVDVKLHDAVYNFGRAKYLGLDAHLGAICVANGWLDKVKVTFDKNGKRHFKLPFIHQGDVIKMPEKSQLKELDRQAFKYWNEKFPKTKNPKGNEPKDNPPQQTPSPTPTPDELKREHDIAVAKKVAQNLQEDLVRKKAYLDRGIGNIFGRGVDAFENLWGKGSNPLAKTLDEKQKQVKELGKQANEGKLDEFGKIHKNLTGADFDPSKKQTASFNLDGEFKEFNKNHANGVDQLSDLATLGANWWLSSKMGAAKGVGSLVKQGLLMMGFGGAVKTGAKALEHGNFNTGADDFRSGAVSGLAFFAGDKVTRGVHSKFQAQTLQKYLLRGALSGGSGGAVYGAVETPNAGYNYARNEGRKYELSDGVNDSLKGAGGGFAGGALLGTAFGGWGYRNRVIPAPKALENNNPMPGLAGGKAGPELGAPKVQGEAPQAPAEAPQAQAEAPQAQAEAPQAQAEAPQAQAEAPQAQGEAPQPQPEVFEAKPPVWEADRLPEWNSYQVQEGSTWQQLVNAYRKLVTYTHPTSVEQRVGLNLNSPEHQAFVNSPEYKANVRLFQAVVDKYDRINKAFKIPTAANDRAAVAPKEAIKLWNELQAAVNDMHLAHAGL